MVGMIAIKDGITALVKRCLLMDALHGSCRVDAVVTRAVSAALRKKRRKRKKRTTWTRPSKAKRKSKRVCGRERLPPMDAQAAIAMLVASELLDDDDDDGDFEHDEAALPNPRAKHFRDLNLHTMIVGPSGCGKTTVARHLAAIYTALGLTNGTFTAIAPQNLKGKYCGWTAANLKEEIAKNAGGVMFIDEAYSMKNCDTDGFGSEILNGIVEQMTNPTCTTTFIMAGYAKAIQTQLLGANEGLERRFGAIYAVQKPTVHELAELWRQKVSVCGWKTTVTTEQASILLAQNPEVCLYHGGDMTSLADPMCHDAHIHRIFPNRLSRVITKEDFSNAILLFKKLKNRTTAPQPVFSLYM